MKTCLRRRGEFHPVYMVYYVIISFINIIIIIIIIVAIAITIVIIIIIVVIIIIITITKLSNMIGYQLP